MSDPADPVSIDTNYLGDPQDLNDLVAGLSIGSRNRQFFCLASFHVARSGAWLDEHGGVRRILSQRLGTHWHQSGTAKMGRDAMSVVDGQLKVYGMEGLRIAGASILPRVTTGNTMAPCVVIGEQAAAFLLNNDG
jgi:choline dehydrogenase